MPGTALVSPLPGTFPPWVTYTAPSSPSRAPQGDPPVLGERGDDAVVVDEQLADVAVAEHDPAVGHDHWAFGKPESRREQRDLHLGCLHPGRRHFRKAKCSKSKSDRGWPTFAAENPVIFVL